MNADRRNPRYLRREELELLKSLTRDTPSRRLLVPLDGSALAERTLGIVRAIARRSPCEITLLNVLNEREPIPDAARYLDECRRALEETTDAVVRYHLMEGDAAERIVGFAEDHRSSLIVMATHGRTGIGRLVRGSVTEAVLRRASAPVLAANPSALDAVDSSFRKIFVAIEGAATPPDVLPVVMDMAKTFGASVTLFYAIEPVVAEMGEPALALLGPTPAEAAAWLEPHRAKLASEGIDARVKIATGPAASAILATAALEDADLVALTTHGRNGIERFLWGSVAEDVLRRCRRPVLITRATALEPAA